MQQTSSSQPRPVSPPISPLTPVLNHISGTVIISAMTGALGSGVGYLCSRMIRPIDPRTAFVCGATAGAVKVLFNTRGSDTPSKIVGLALLVFVPFKICQRLALPATFKMTVTLTATVAAIINLAIILAKNKKNRVE